MCWRNEIKDGSVSLLMLSCSMLSAELRTPAENMCERANDERAGGDGDNNEAALTWKDHARERVTAKSMAYITTSDCLLLPYVSICRVELKRVAHCARTYVSLRRASMNNVIAYVMAYASVCRDNMKSVVSSMMPYVSIRRENLQIVVLEMKSHVAICRVKRR